MGGNDAGNRAAVDKANAEARGPRTTGTISSEAREAFEKLTPEQRRNVMNWGTPNGLAPDRMPSVKFAPEDVPHLTKLQDARQALMARQELVKQTVNEQFGRPVPITEDPHYLLYPPRGMESVGPAAYADASRTGALAEEMARLSQQYPGGMSRMTNLTVGRAAGEAEAWYRSHGRVGAPGEVRYELGTPGVDALLKGNRPEWAPLGTRQPSFREMSAFGINPEQFAARGTEGYDHFLNAISTHELGHQTHASMADFVKSLPDNSEAKAKFVQFQRRLATQNAAHIGGYADDARNFANEHSMQQYGVGDVTQASKEPFAELFSVARSPAAFDYAQTGNKTALQAMMGGRDATKSAKLMDNIGELNSVEKSLRNEGFSEVGAAAPGMLMQLGLPALTGLLASKTHGNVKAALGGATVGAGIGGMFGPEGTLVGGALGAGAGLARQLL